MLCWGYTLTDFPISIRLTSLALWQSNDCPSASKATLMNMDKYFMWIHYERLCNHNKAKHNKTVCIFLGIYCNSMEISYTILYLRVAEIMSHLLKTWHHSMAKCKTAVTPVRQQWSYCSLALNHWFNILKPEQKDILLTFSWKKMFVPRGSADKGTTMVWLTPKRLGHFFQKCIFVS